MYIEFTGYLEHNFLFLKRKHGINEAPVAININRLIFFVIIFQKKLCSRLEYNEK